MKEPAHLDSITRSVAGLCAHLGLVLDGGISYKDITEHFTTTLGGIWLHYGGQRGCNGLAQAHVLALIASPTAPPDALERKARALWSDDQHPIDRTSTRVGQGDYRATDERLEAVNRLHGREELRQAAHRCRPILSQESTTLLIFSPWDLEPLGLKPHKIVPEIPHGNSKASQQGYEEYQKLRDRRGEDSAGEVTG